MIRNKMQACIRWIDGRNVSHAEIRQIAKQRIIAKREHVKRSEIYLPARHRLCILRRKGILFGIEQTLHVLR